MVTKNKRYQISPSVNQILNSFGESKEVSASQLVEKLFSLHPEYANKLAGNMQIYSTRKKQIVNEWLQQIEELFDWEKIANFSEEQENKNEFKQMEESNNVQQNNMKK